VFCPNCGKEQAGDSTHCGNCGANLVQKPGIEPGTSYMSIIEYAGFWKRLVAWIIDSILINIINLIIGIVLASFIGTDIPEDDIDATFLAIFYPLSFIVVWLYYAITESSSIQATPGKIVLGIKVTDSEGKRISFLRATGRNFAKIISTLILLIGYIMIAFTQKKQGLHDIIADTLVVSK